MTEEQRPLTHLPRAHASCTCPCWRVNAGALSDSQLRGRGEGCRRAVPLLPVLRFPGTSEAQQQSMTPAHPTVSPCLIAANDGMCLLH